MVNRSICFHCDNMSVVCAVSSLSTSSPPVIALLRRLVLLCLRWNILFWAQYVPGVSNEVANVLSRFQLNRFWNVVPEADRQSVPCPRLLWQELGSWDG